MWGRECGKNPSHPMARSGFLPSDSPLYTPHYGPPTYYNIANKVGTRPSNAITDLTLFFQVSLSPWSPLQPFAYFSLFLLQAYLYNLPCHAATHAKESKIKYVSFCCGRKMFNKATNIIKKRHVTTGQLKFTKYYVRDVNSA